MVTACATRRQVSCRYASFLLVSSTSHVGVAQHPKSRRMQCHSALLVVAPSSLTSGTPRRLRRRFQIRRGSPQRCKSSWQSSHKRHNISTANHRKHQNGRGTKTRSMREWQLEPIRGNERCQNPEGRRRWRVGISEEKGVHKPQCSLTKRRSELIFTASPQSKAAFWNHVADRPSAGHSRSFAPASSLQQLCWCIHPAPSTSSSRPSDSWNPVTWPFSSIKLQFL